MAESPRVRGLPAIEQARETRAKLRWPGPKFWAYVGLVLAVGAVLRWKWTQGEVDSQRQTLLAKQRAVAAEMGPRWSGLRDSVEGWTLALAKAHEPEIVDRDALASWDFREKPGIYLRLSIDQAGDVESIRKHARSSLRDAFTACLMRYPNPSPIAGAACVRTRDCPPGEFCNEADHCSRPGQPFNLRVAYRTLHVVSDVWVREVQDASSELRLRLFADSFADTVQDDLPLAADLLTRAQYFLLVLDEPPAEGAPEPSDGASTPTEALHGVRHPARIAVFRISDGKTVVRVRREAGGQLVGGMPQVEAGTMAARQRQANSCSLALAVREAMGDLSAASAPPGD